MCIHKVDWITVHNCGKPKWHSSYILHIPKWRDRWGTTEDFKAYFFHPSLSSASLKASPSFRPVHSRMFSPHLFLCLPLALCPCNVPCSIVLASSFDLTSVHIPLQFAGFFPLWSGHQGGGHFIKRFVSVFH